MFIPDMPNVPPQDVPVMIAQANQAQAGDVLGNFEGKNVQHTGTITILQQPKHGILRLVTEADGNRFGEGRFDPASGLYAYLPKKGYVGKDSATALVEIAGVKVKVVYFFQAWAGGLGNIGRVMRQAGLPLENLLQGIGESIRCPHTRRAFR